jgi:hypothetical protein
MTNDEATFATIRQRIQALNRDAFELARNEPPAEGPDLDRERAEEIDRQLGELIEPIRALPEDEQSAVLDEWNDARMDVGYVVAGRRGPMSTRLGRWLESNAGDGEAADEAGPEPPAVS